ncbi:GGDEF domain-containing protein [Acinetobacter sp. ANC 4648]|uniref:GGDEF domain-containing protein n=1 Tax=Acinetobacter sp. ANC 4648 TaxID=1977875 RepID=UPI00148A7D2B|nr:GGDEF domain-containing protein [Acinetobacter sp. ANC 4648]
MSIGYFTGIMSIVTGVFTIGSIFSGLLLFDRKIVIWGTLPCLLILYISSILNILNIIPYAPIYRPYTLVSQSMQTYMIVLNLGISTFVGTILLGLFNACLDRWTAREQDQRTLMILDPLTQILNRRGFSEKFEKIKNNSAPHQLPLCIALLDIDCFKKINDQYGHDCGDEVLKTIAQILLLTLRQQDFIGRFGGEEFVIILSNTKIITAKKILERCRKAIENYALIYKGTTIRFTASFGLCSSVQQGYQQRDLLLAADQMLYQAKSFGRNCIQVAHQKINYQTDSSFS